MSYVRDLSELTWCMCLAYVYVYDDLVVDRAEEGLIDDVITKSSEFRVKKESNKTSCFHYR